MKLTRRQEKFALAYIETGNASAAYRRSYDVAKWADKSIWESASRLLANAKVASRVAELQAKHLAKHEVTVHRVLSEYRKIAFLDARKAFDEDGNLKPVHDLDDDTAAAVAGIEFEEIFERSDGGRNHVGRIHKIKLSDKIRALDSLAKHLGMFVDRVEVSGTVDLATRLVAARKRTDG